MEPSARRRDVIKRERVRVSAKAPDSPLASPTGDGCARAPAVRLVPLGAGQAFEFTCSCGEVSLIEILIEKTNPGPKTQ